MNKKTDQKNERVVLYRKYRPQSFTEVVGQTHITTVLQNALKQNRIAHAYLFSGPRGTGKTTVARILAKEMGAEPEDIVEIDAASSRGIDEARALRDAVHFLPLKSPKKVYIIDEVHMLTKEAFNALLKTLEEPPAHALFILATTEPNKVLDTIISRTQHFAFRKISTADIVRELTRIARLEHIPIDEGAVKILAFFADGGLRDAENLLLQAASLSDTAIDEKSVRMMLGAPEEEALHDIIRAAAEENVVDVLNLFDEMMDGGFDPMMVGRLLTRSMRALYFVTLDERLRQSLTEEFSHESLSRLLEIKTVLQNKENKNPAIWLENSLEYLLKALQMPLDDAFAHLPLELALIKIAHKL
jgi:DNA polymerase-3 subunit gamma/tau